MLHLPYLSKPSSLPAPAELPRSTHLDLEHHIFIHTLALINLSNGYLYLSSRTRYEAMYATKICYNYTVMVEVVQ